MNQILRQTSDLAQTTDSVTAVREIAIDYHRTAQVAAEAFGAPATAFSPDRLRWFYEQCFSLGAIVVALRDGDTKVGQIAMVIQPMTVNGVVEHVVQIVDLFVLKPYRSKLRLRQLYDEASRQCEALQIRFALGMPNKAAVSVNAHFFQLAPFLWLPIRAGISLRKPRASSLRYDGEFSAMAKQEATALLSIYRTALTETGIEWNGERLLQRLNGHGSRYGIHASDNLLLISSPRVHRGIAYVMLCGYFTREGTTAASHEARQLVRAACRLWRRPLHVYAGLNASVPAMPGVVLPTWFRPSLMLLQLRDFAPDQPPLRLDRFQLLDFDLA